LNGQVNRGHTNKIAIPPPQRAAIRKVTCGTREVLGFRHCWDERCESDAVCGSCLVMKENLKATLPGNGEADLPVYFL